MKTGYQSGEILDYVAGADYSSGDVIVVGDIVGMALNDIASGATGPVLIEGIVKVVKTASQAWTAGATVYYDSGNEEFTTTASGNSRGGVAAFVAASGASLTTGYVILNASPGADVGTQAAHIADPASAAALTQEALTDSTTGTPATTLAAGTGQTQTALTDNGGGTADGTVAAQAAPVTLTDSTGYDGTHNDTVAAMSAIVTVTDSSQLDGSHDDTVAAITNTDSLTDSSGGTADDTIAADAAVSVFAIPIPDMIQLANGDIMTEFVPGFAGHILRTFWLQEDPITTGAKAATLNFEIETTNVTGGEIALASATLATLGQYIAGAAVTADNAFTAAEKISIEASSVTAFAEGSGTIYIVVSNDAVNDNLKEIADQLATQHTLNTALAQNQSNLAQKAIELVARDVVAAQNISDLAQKVIELVTLAGVAQANLKEVTTALALVKTDVAAVKSDAIAWVASMAAQLALVKTDVAAVRTGSEANNTTIDSINAALEGFLVTASS